MTGERAYIAEIDDSATLRENGRKLAWAQPLVRSTEYRETWEGPVASVDDDFPSRGLVFWFDAPRETNEGDYYEIEVGEHPQYGEPGKSEKYQVVGHRKLVEVVDLREWREADVRRALNSSGLSIEPAPMSSEILFWIADDRWVGPVEIGETDAGTWTLETNDVTRLDCRTPGPDACREVQLDEPRLVVAPGHDFGESRGYVNWAPDVEFAEGLLKRIRKLDQSVYEALDVTYAVFEKHQEVLAASGLSGPDLQHERARLERAEELKDLIETNEELLNEAVSALLESEVVRSELEEEKRKLRRETRDRLEREIGEELESKRSEIEELDSRIEARRGELEDVEAKTEKEKERLEEQIASFEDVLRKRLDDLSEVEPENLFADSVVLRAMLSPSRRDSSSTDDSESGASRTPWENSKEDSARFDEVTEAASSFSKRAAVGRSGSLDLFSAFSASEAVCLAGSRTDEILDAFADAVAGGRLLWIPVPGASIAPTDFLVSRNDGRIAPHPNGLLDTLVEAASSDRLYLVVFEGFDRAPVESYLRPLLASRSESMTSGRGRRAVPLPARVSVAGDSVARVAWPSNVLVACTPTAGAAATLTVPRSFWTFSSLVGTDSHEDDDVSKFFDTEKDESPTEIGASVWNDLRRRMREEFDTAPVNDAAHSASSSSADVSLAEDLYAAARSLGRSEDEALATAARLGLLPRIAHETDSAPRDLAQNFRSDGEAADAVFELVQKYFG